MHKCTVNVVYNNSLVQWSSITPTMYLLPFFTGHAIFFSHFRFIVTFKKKKSFGYVSVLLFINWLCACLSLCICVYTHTMSRTREDSNSCQINRIYQMRILYCIYKKLFCSQQIYYSHMHIMFNEINTRSHSNDYNWRTIYHLANDCSDTFTLIWLTQNAVHFLQSLHPTPPPPLFYTDLHSLCSKRYILITNSKATIVYYEFGK